MLKGDNNLKDTQSNSIKDTTFPVSSPVPAINHMVSYTKTNKLITALYMVTDMIEKEEPLRNKLRSLGTEIITDIHSDPIQAGSKIYDVMSFLDIASTINLISEMNHNILKKEFLELYQSIQEYLKSRNKQVSIEDLFPQSEEIELKTKQSSFTTYAEQPASLRPLHNGQSRTRIGVQKGGTLMKILSEKTHSLAKPHVKFTNVINFDVLKEQRRKDIIEILKGKVDGITIKDIKNTIKDRNIISFISSGEKTLQRELASMVKDNLLLKTGEKRWSRYALSR